MTPRSLTLIAWLTINFAYTTHAQSPGGISTGLTLWVKADAALPSAVTPATGGVLTSWPDSKSTAPKNTFHLSATTGMATVVNVVNFHPVVRFTGASKLIGNTSISWSECSAVASWTGTPASERGTVISPTTNGTEPQDESRYFFRSGVEGNPANALFTGMGIDSIGFEYTDAPATAQVNLFTASGKNDVFNRNGLDVRTGNLFGGLTKRLPASFAMTAIPQIGDRSTDDSPMKGDIAEIIVYGSDNSANRNRVESYLALKYGLTLGNLTSPISYTSSTGVVFWTATAGYQHNIFGIGTDVNSGLTQFVSNSMNSGTGNGAGRGGLGNLVITAPAALTNQQFLMIGTDSGFLTQEQIEPPMGPTLAKDSWRLFRTWKAMNTGSVGAIKLTFDVSGITGLKGGTTATNYYLMVDNDGDGNWNTGTQSYYKASGFSSNPTGPTNTLLTFNPLTLNNNVVFTIITLPNALIPLPVSFESFTATASRQTVSLRWTVGEEEGIDHYDIDRSADGTNFSRADSLPAQNTTENARYAYSEQLAPGLYYYRIRMTNRDGQDQFSTIRSLVIGGQVTMQIRSNPIHNNQLQLDIDLPLKNTARIIITDRQGKRILQTEQVLQPGSNQVTIDLSFCSRGLYYVQVKAGAEQHTLPFLR